MNATSYDIKDMLVEESALALVYADNLFIGHMPTTPHNCTCIYDSPGYAPDLGLDYADYYRPGIQISVRNRSYNTGWNLINDIMVSLHGRHSETWNGTLYTLIQCASEPAALGQDENQLFRFVLNLNVQRRV